MKLRAFIFAVSTALWSQLASSATVTIPLLGDPAIVPPCASTPYLNEVIATSIDGNGTVHGQVEYVGKKVIAFKVAYFSVIYSATWDVTGNLVAASLLKNNGCTAINPLTGVFAQSTASSVHAYTNGYYTATSRYLPASMIHDAQWATVLSH